MGVAHDKGIGLTAIEVDVTQKQNLVVSGPNDPNQRKVKIDRIVRNIRVEGALKEGDTEHLLWGANNCPVSNTLEGGVEIVTQLELNRPQADQPRSDPEPL